jgi:hypothetical protein
MKEGDKDLSKSIWNNIPEFSSKNSLEHNSGINIQKVWLRAYLAINPYYIFGGLACAESTQSFEDDFILFWCGQTLFLFSLKRVIDITVSVVIFAKVCCSCSG